MQSISLSRFQQSVKSRVQRCTIAQEGPKGRALQPEIDADEAVWAKQEHTEYKVKVLPFNPRKDPRKKMLVPTHILKAATEGVLLLAEQKRANAVSMHG